MSTPTPTRAIVSLWRLPAMRHLVAATVLGFTSFCLTVASLPTWAVAGGVGVAAAGLVTTAMLVATVALQGLVAAMVRRWGLARVLAAGLISLGAPAPALLLDQHLPWLLVVSAVRGCGFGILTVLGADLTARVTPAGRRGEAVGIYGLAIAVPNLVAIPAAVALTLAGHFAVVAWLAACPVLAVPLVAGLARAAATAHDQAIPPEEVDDPAHRAAWAAVRPSVILLVVTLAGGGLITFLPIELPHGSIATLALLAFGLTGALCRWGAGLLADRSSRWPLLALSLVVATAGLAGVAGGLGSGSGALVIGSAAVFGIGFGSTQNLTLLAAFARAGARHSTTASAVWNAAFDAGTAIGAVAVGAVAADAGLAWTYVGCAALIAVSVVLAPLRTGVAVA